MDLENEQEGGRMNVREEVATKTGDVGSALGRGLIAGAVATVAITLSQLIEMKINKREMSTVPADAASKVLDVKPATKNDKQKMANEVHWAYGTTWGVARGLFSLFGLKGLPSTALHFASVYTTALIMLPSLKVSPPVKKWGAKAIAVDAWHHLVYAAVAGLVFDEISQQKK